MGNGYGGAGDNGYDASISAAFIAIAIVFVAVELIVIVALYVVNSIAFMRLFRRTGVEPWAAWVPVFYYWRLLELGGQPGWLSLLSFVPFGSYVTTVFLCLGAYRTGIGFRKTGGWVVLFIFLPFVWAFMLSGRTEVYQPDLIRQAGYGPPLVGYGSARGPYVPAQPPSASQQA